MTISEHAVDQGLARRGLALHSIQQGNALVFGWRRLAVEIEQGCGDVDRLRQRIAAAARQMAQRRVVHQLRDVRHLVVAGHEDLGPPVVFAQQETVVGGDDERRVLPHRMGVHVVHQAPEFMVTQCHGGAIVGT